MKKKIFCFIIPVFSLLIGAGFTGNKNPQKLDASITEKTVISDSFNDSSFKSSVNPNIWTDMNTSEKGIRQSEEGFTYLTQSGTNKGVEFFALSTRQKLSGIRSLQFDIYFGEKQESSFKWISPYFVNEQWMALKNLENGGYAYNGVTRMTYLQILNCDGYADFDNGESSWNLVPNIGVGSTKTWYTVRYDIQTSTHATFNVGLQGEELDPAKAVGFTYDHEGCSLNNAYIVLAASNERDEVRFDNIKIDSDTREIDENFNACDLYNEDCPFEIIHNEFKDIKETSFEVVDNCVLEFNNSAVGDFIYSKTSVKDLTNGINDLNVLTLSFKVKMTNKADKFGIVFGYNSLENNLNKKCVVYEINKNNGLLVEYDENGTKITDDSVNKNSFTNIAGEALITISFSKTNGVTITENNTPVRSSGNDVVFQKVTNYLGQIAFVTLARSSDNLSSFYIDQVDVKSDSYYRPVTKSVSHGFNQEYWGPEDKPDFYVKETPENCISVDGGRLIFKGASDNTFFGSAHQYDDFVMDFKLMSIYGDPSNTEGSRDITSAERWIGFDISRSKVDYSAYGSYCMVGMYITPGLDKETANVFAYADETHRNQEYFNQIQINRYKNIPASLFRDITYSDISLKSSISTEDAVCIRYVSEGGKLSLYLKKNSELNYTKYLTISNIDLQGYFALTCTGYTYLEMDDFSMTNTSSIFECADTYEPEPIIKVETNVVYDNDYADKETNLAEEIKINSEQAGCKGSILAGSIVVSVCSMTSIIGLVLRKKKVCEK